MPSCRASTRRSPRRSRSTTSRSAPPTPCRPTRSSVAVALADKLDMLVGFWAIDEKPTGSKDPYALRRAALGVIRLVLENGLRLPLDRYRLAGVFGSMYWDDLRALTPPSGRKPRCRARFALEQSSVAVDRTCDAASWNGCEARVRPSRLLPRPPQGLSARQGRAVRPDRRGAGDRLRLLVRPAATARGRATRLDPRLQGLRLPRPIERPPRSPAATSPPAGGRSRPTTTCWPSSAASRRCLNCSERRPARTCSPAPSGRPTSLRRRRRRERGSPIGWTRRCSARKPNRRFRTR